MATCAGIGRDVLVVAVTDGWSPRVIEVVGRFAAASNATLLATTDEGERVIYKPIAGEQPLWDFPAASLAIREVLTYQIDVALGFDVVPETVMGGGPYGPGAVQRYVDTDPEFDPVALVRSADPVLWPIAVLDLVTNNADRKLGHLLGAAQDVRAIDHGLTFHVDDKLRTVLWVFADDPIPPPLLECLASLDQALEHDLGRRIRAELSRTELAALRRRVATLLEDPYHPPPPSHRPSVPWPPY
jgi:uncharacterized repeat protein (TIGR03843 family)